MPQPTAIKQRASSEIVKTNRTTELFDSSPSSAGWNTNNPYPARSSILQRHSQAETLEPFVEAGAAAEFLRYSSRTVKQMAREGRIPAHPFGTGPRKRWYFLISELAEHLRAQVNCAHGEAGRDKTQRRVI
jgi:Helix-turn-helix domain